VIAEGVETKAQLKLLREHRCDEGQGFLFGRPRLADAFENLLNNQLDGDLLGDFGR
jgi:EAL domain-containing protein (putative c-di-GMP-specific phosphodiesterase class I)